MSFDYDRLRDLVNLFRHRGDVLVLLGLREHPRRFSELARAIVEQSGAHDAEQLIQRSTPRLKESGILAVDDDGHRHPVYRLTAHGREKAALVGFVLEALKNRDENSC